MSVKDKRVFFTLKIFYSFLYHISFSVFIETHKRVNNVTSVGPPLPFTSVASGTQSSEVAPKIFHLRQQN